tara:strand:- start:169 stop:420 length:252 start_codon:yes stop_codon:yes gene_type:complete
MLTPSAFHFDATVRPFGEKAPARAAAVICVSSFVVFFGFCFVITHTHSLSKENEIRFQLNPEKRHSSSQKRKRFSFSLRKILF